MDHPEIENNEALSHYLQLLAHDKAAESTRSLQEYLRALYGMFQTAPANDITPAHIGQLFHDAFLAEPILFQQNWLTYTTPADPEDESRAPFPLCQEMICFQIADLHRMAQANLLTNPHRSGGLTSPTGLSWYNFDPSTYLQCAAQGFSDNGNPHLGNGWRDLALLLLLGQIYE